MFSDFDPDKDSDSEDENILNGIAEATPAKYNNEEVPKTENNEQDTVNEKELTDQVNDEETNTAEVAENTDHDNEVSDSDKLKAELDTLAQLLDKSLDSLKTVKELEKSVGSEENEEMLDKCKSVLTQMYE